MTMYRIRTNLNIVSVCIGTIGSASVPDVSGGCYFEGIYTRHSYLGYLWSPIEKL